MSPDEFKPFMSVSSENPVPEDPNQPRVPTFEEERVRASVSEMINYIMAAVGFGLGGVVSSVMHIKHSELTPLNVIMDSIVLMFALEYLLYAVLHTRPQSALANAIDAVVLTINGVFLTVAFLLLGWWPPRSWALLFIPMFYLVAVLSWIRLSRQRRRIASAGS